MLAVVISKAAYFICSNFFSPCINANFLHRLLLGASVHLSHTKSRKYLFNIGDTRAVDNSCQE